jgi:hypothetical protein
MLNRKDRRSLNKGDLNTRSERINQAEKNLRERLDHIDREVVHQGKMFASAVIQQEYMPMIRDVLHFDLKASDEQIAIFEEKFNERMKKRLDSMIAP